MIEPPKIVPNPLPTTLETLEGETFHAPEGGVIVQPLDTGSPIAVPGAQQLYPIGIITSVGKGSVIEAACQHPTAPADPEYMAHYRNVVDATRIPIPYRVGDVVIFAGQPYQYPEMPSEGVRLLLPFNSIVATVDPSRVEALKAKVRGLQLVRPAGA